MAITINHWDFDVKERLKIKLTSYFVKHGYKARYIEYSYQGKEGKKFLV